MRARLKSSIVFAAILLGTLPGVAKAGDAASASQAIATMLATPEKSLDLARAKLTFDKLVDPSIDVEAWLRRIDGMGATVKAMAGPSADPIRKLAAVRTYIYQSGDWNAHRPYHYDMSDPLGTKIPDKLLPNYLTTKAGNCVSMPALFIILASKLGLHVTASTAPMHVFARFVDDRTGKTFNLETTSGGLPARDAWLRQNFPMSDLAIRNGVYLKTLSRKETAAVFAEVVIENDLATAKYQDAIDAANAILKYYPHYVPAMLGRADASAHIVETGFKAKYPTLQDIPAEILPTFISLDEQSRHDIARARELGWRETDGIIGESGDANIR